MHDIWNPWHGCIRCSEGCDHCYMYYLDGIRDQDGSDIRPILANANYPIQRDRTGAYKIRSGEQLRVCMTSDFFLEEADAWRHQTWDMIWQWKHICQGFFHMILNSLQSYPPKSRSNGYSVCYSVVFGSGCRVPLMSSMTGNEKEDSYPKGNKSS